MRGRGVGFLAAAAAVAAMVAAAVWLVGESGQGNRIARSVAEDSRSPEPPEEGLEIPVGSRRPVEGTEAEVPDPSEEAFEPRTRWTARVRGRLVMKDGGPLPDDTIVSLWTEDHGEDPEESVADRARSWVDASTWLFRWTGGAAAPGRSETSRFRARAGGDGWFEIAVPPDFPRFRFQVEARFAVYPEKEAWYDLGGSGDAGWTLELDPAGAVEGRVTSTRGTPLPGARMDLRWVAGAVAEADGTYALDGLPPGSYRLLAEFAGVRVDPIGLEVRARETAIVDVEVALGSTLSGIVVDRFGSPAPLSRLMLSPEEPDGTTSKTVLRTGDSGEDGAFFLASIPPGRYRLFVNPADGRFGTAVPGIEIPPGAEIAGMRIVLPEWHFVAGRVLDASGAPAAGALVAARDDSRLPLASGRRSKNVCVETAQDGSFRIEGLDEGPLALHVLLPGVCEVGLDGFEPDTEGIEIRLPGATGIAGRVVDGRTGSPIARFAIESSWSAPPGGRRRSGGSGPSGRFADDAGRFELLGLKEGTYGLLVRADGYVSTAVPDLPTTSGRVRGDLEVRLSPGATVRGFVWDADSESVVAGAKVSHDAQVRVSRLWTTSLRSEARSGLDGGFELRAVAPGEGRVRASIPGRPPGESETIEAIEGRTIEDVRVTIPIAGKRELLAPAEIGSCTVTGTVVRGTEAVSGASVAVRPRDSRGGGSRGPEGRTKADGSFEVRGVPPGPAWLEVVVEARPRRVLLPIPIEVPDEPTYPVDVRLPDARLTGQVVRLADGSPVVGAIVDAVGAGTSFGGRQASASTKTDSQGRYLLEELPSGRYRVSAYPRAGWVDKVGLAIGLAVVARDGVILSEGTPGVLDFALPEGFSATVTVLDEEGRPVPNATVRIGSGAGGQAERTDSKGVARFDGLLRGAHDVEVEAEGLPKHRRTVLLDSGSAVEIEIRLEAGTR